MISPGPTSQPWRDCYRQLAPKLLLFARQWVESPADAEDLVQTAFVRFWQKHPDAAAEHYPLLYAAVRSAALDALRSRERRGRRETAYHADAAGSAGEFFRHPLELQEEAAAVQNALQRLGAEQREVLVLRIWGELTFAEIAQALDQSINTVASRYRAGLEALRRFFANHPPFVYERV
jgi:RNA polymerase sigma-70 factor (ECF subfamily)